MLCQFSFQNFKSYKDETTFDFRAMAIPEFQDALIRQEKAKTYFRSVQSTAPMVAVRQICFRHSFA